MPINGKSTNIDERHSRVHPPHATTLSRQHKTSSKYKAAMPRRTTSLIPLARIPSQIPSNYVDGHEKNRTEGHSGAEFFESLRQERQGRRGRRGRSTSMTVAATTKDPTPRKTRPQPRHTETYLRIQRPQTRACRRLGTHEPIPSGKTAGCSSSLGTSGAMMGPLLKLSFQNHPVQINKCKGKRGSYSRTPRWSSSLPFVGSRVRLGVRALRANQRRRVRCVVRRGPR